MLLLLHLLSTPLLLLIASLPGPSCSQQPTTRFNLYEKKADDKILPYLMRKEVTVVGDVECARTCLEDPTCASFNLGPTDAAGKNKCQVNFDSNRDSGIELVDQADWLYYEGTEEPAATEGATSAAYDSFHKWWFMAYGGLLMRFLELQTGAMLPQNSTSLQGYDVQGLLVLNASDDQILFRCYLKDGGLANATLQLSDFGLTITPLTDNITDLHGPEVEGDIRDIVTFDGDTYLFAGNSTYILDPDTEAVVQEFWSFDGSVAENPFYAMPRYITAATEISHPQLMFFKGMRLYFFDGDQERVTGGASLTSA